MIECTRGSLVGKTQPPENWPWLEDIDPNSMTHKPDLIVKVAEALREIAGPLNGQGLGDSQGSINDLSAYTQLKDVRDQLRTPSRWPGGPAMASTLETAHREFVKVYQEVLDNLEIAIELVETGAGITKQTEIVNRGGV